MGSGIDGIGVLYLMVIGYIAFIVVFSTLFASGIIYYGKKHKFPNYAIVLAVIVEIIALLFLPPIMFEVYQRFRMFRSNNMPLIINKIKLAITPKSAHIKKYKELIVVLLNDYNNQCATEISNMSNKIAIIENELLIINNNINELKALNKEETYYKIMSLNEQYNNLDKQKNILNSQLNEIKNNSQIIQLKNYMNDLRYNSHLSLAEMTEIENEVSKTIPNTCAVSIFAL